MSAQPRCIRAVLYWCFDKEYYCSAQSTRSWSYAGSEHVTLRFVLPQMPRTVTGVRLALEPSPAGIAIQNVRLFNRSSVRSWKSPAVSIDDFGTLAARISPYSEPTAGEIESSLFTVKIDERELRCLKTGGTLELVLALTFSEKSPQRLLLQEGSGAGMEPAIMADYLLPARAPFARHLQEMHSEVNRLAAALTEVYESNSWKYTGWCREFMVLCRSLPAWPLCLLIMNNLRRLAGSPLNFRSRIQAVEKVDVIVPVYGSFEHVKRCLGSVLNAPVTVPYELIVVDDASPDSKLAVFLQELKDKGQITLLKNIANVGFTGTVNRGMSLHPDRDIVLLNSDTTVHNDWLGRLQSGAYCKNSIATVTPFSNNGSICSYPNTGKDCDIQDDREVAELDELFATVNARQIVEIPTAVGFCMYIKRECLKQTGLFDAKTFPGYGEENDFCERASKLGWLHVLAADTFVYHAGSTSYGDSQWHRKRAAYDSISKEHPDYQPAVRKFAQADPVRHLRHRVGLKRLQKTKKPIILMILHGLAGGTEKHVLELVKFFQNQVEFLSLRAHGDYAQIKWLNENESFSVDFHLNAEWKDIEAFLKSLPIQRIHIHHFLGLETRIGTLIKKLDVPYDFTVHDFYAVCPQGWLCDYRQRYCGQPDEKGCNACLAVLPHRNALNIQEWRCRYGSLIDEAQRVFVPSKDALARISMYLPPRPYIIASHLDSDLVVFPRPAPRAVLPGERMRKKEPTSLMNARRTPWLESCRWNFTF